jgi:hypothetical protein
MLLKFINSQKIDVTQIMYLMALDEFMHRGPATGDASYHGIAAIHGGQQSYNGVGPGGDGCVAGLA